MKPKPKAKPRSRKKHMEPNQTNTTSPLSKQYTLSRKVWIIIGGVVVALAIAAGVTCYYRYFYLTPISPAPVITTPKEVRLQELEKLQAESTPVTATPIQRTATMQSLQKSSKSVKTSQADRLAELQKLQTSSH